MNIYIDNQSRSYLERQNKLTGQPMSKIISAALAEHRKANEINLFEMIFDLWDKVGMYINQVEADRDYNNREFTPSETEIYDFFNKTWEEIRKLSAFRELPEERAALERAHDPEKWLKENPYKFYPLPE